MPKRRVLVVEDEYLVAMMIEDMLVELDCEVVGPANELQEALGLAADGAFDFALLDLNLAGTDSYPVADALTARGIRFAFVTGYEASHIRLAYRHHLLLQKPVALQDLERILATADPPA